MRESPTYLAVFSLLDRLLHQGQRVLGVHSWFDQLVVDHAHFNHKIFLELCVLLPELGRPHQQSFRSLNGLVALVRVTSPKNRRIEALELGDEPMLVCEDGGPRVSPCFGRIDDLPVSVLPVQPHQVTHFGQ